MKRFALGLAATAISATAALAQVDVDQLDADDDSFASEEEVMAMIPDFDPTFFGDIDTNDDGRWSAEELNTGEAQEILARYYPGEQADETVDLESLDTDDDGFVSQMEFEAAYPGVDWTLANDIDTNDDNRLGPEELNTGEAQTIIAQIAPASQAETVDVAALDTDGDGFVSQEEFAAHYPDVDWEQANDIDTNDDNRLSPEELNTSEAQEIISRFE